MLTYTDYIALKIELLDLCKNPHKRSNLEHVALSLVYKCRDCTIKCNGCAEKKIIKILSSAKE